METQVSTCDITLNILLQENLMKNIRYFICERTLKHAIEYPVMLHILYLVEVYKFL